MGRVYERIRGLMTGEEGATATEYAIMAALIAAVIAATVGSLGQALKGLFEKVPRF